MTGLEKKALVLLTAAFILGAIVLTVRRVNADRHIAANPVKITGEVGGLCDVDKDDLMVDVNVAASYELEALPGVGPVIASRIIAYREERGPFREVEDLLNVPGIGPGRLEAIKGFVTVGSEDR